jgi:ABC-type dipeptide/oligopeptide/nickel transport system permease subunit
MTESQAISTRLRDVVDERIVNNRFGRLLLATIMENRLALLGFVILLVVMFMAVFADVIAPYDPTAQNLTARFLPPSLEHPMGTDRFGRDIFSRVVHGARLSLIVSIVSVSFAMVMGVPLGLTAGYVGGYTDEGIMRFMDVLFSFPVIILAMPLVVILGQSTRNVMIAIAIVYTPIFTRVTRSATLSVREELYVKSARAIGESDLNIIRRDILPNAIAPILVQATILLALATLVEASLAFIGIGTPPPTPSWGRMLSSARSHMSVAWWWAVFPGLAIVFTILGWNVLGDAIRDTLDPKSDTETRGL